MTVLGPRQQTRFRTAQSVSLSQFIPIESRSNFLFSLTHPFHKPVQHPLLPRLVEINRELVAINRRNVAVAELEVEDAVADRVGGGRAGGLGDEFAFDGGAARAALAVGNAFDGVAGAGAPVVSCGVGLVGLGTFPAGRVVVAGERFGLVEARSAIGAA